MKSCSAILWINYAKTFISHAAIDKKNQPPLPNLNRICMCVQKNVYDGVFSHTSEFVILWSN